MSIPVSPRVANDSAQRACPACGEQILTIARKCKHCGTWLDTLPSAAPIPRRAAPRFGHPRVQMMSFSDAISSCFGKFATFSGRAPRAEYWFWGLFQMLFGLAGAVCVGLDGTVDPVALMIVSVGLAIVQLVLLLPGLAVFTRRLHDTNRSGWWYFLSLTIIGLIPLLIWLCQAGTDGENEYGSSPYGPRA